MSKRRKGKEFELKIRKFLEARGWIVQPSYQVAVFIGPGKFRTKSADFFMGSCDLLAIHPSKRFTLCASITKGGAPGERIKKLRDVPWNHLVQKPMFFQKRPSMMRTKKCYLKRVASHKAYDDGRIIDLDPAKHQPFGL